MIVENLHGKRDSLGGEDAGTDTVKKMQDKVWNRLGGNVTNRRVSKGLGKRGVHHRPKSVLGKTPCPFGRRRY